MNFFFNVKLQSMKMYLGYDNSKVISIDGLRHSVHMHIALHKRIPLHCRKIPQGKNYFVCVCVQPKKKWRRSYSVLQTDVMQFSKSCACARDKKNDRIEQNKQMKTCRRTQFGFDCLLHICIFYCIHL